MLERVDERLLDDPVRERLDLGCQWHDAALDAQIDRQTGVGHLVGEVVEVGESRARRDRDGGAGREQLPDEPLRVGDRVAARRSR